MCAYAAGTQNACMDCHQQRSAAQYYVYSGSCCVCWVQLGPVVGIEIPSAITPRGVYWKGNAGLRCVSACWSLNLVHHVVYAAILGLIPLCMHCMRPT